MACGGKLKTRNGQKVFPSMQTFGFFQIDFDETTEQRNFSSDQEKLVQTVNVSKKNCVSNLRRVFTFFFFNSARTILLSNYSLQLTLGERYALQFASPPPKGQKPCKRTFPVELKPPPLSLLFR